MSKTDKMPIVVLAIALIGGIASILTSQELILGLLGLLFAVLGAYFIYNLKKKNTPILGEEESESYDAEKITVNVGLCFMLSGLIIAIGATVFSIFNVNFGSWILLALMLIVVAFAFFECRNKKYLKDSGTGPSQDVDEDPSWNDEETEPTEYSEEKVVSEVSATENDDEYEPLIVPDDEDEVEEEK